MPNEENDVQLEEGQESADENAGEDLTNVDPGTPEGEESPIETTPEEEEVFKIRYNTPEGEAETELTADELSDIIAQYKTQPSGDDEIAQMKPYVDLIENHPVLKEVIHYINQGHPEEKLKKGLATLWASSQTPKDEVPPEFDSVEDQIKYYVQQELKKQVDPLKKDYEVLQIERKMTATTRHNDVLIEKALNNIGLSTAKLTDQDYKALGKSWGDIYPGISIDQFPMTAAQANVLIKDALLRQQKRRNAEVRTTAAEVVKQSNAPKVVVSKTIAGREAPPTRFTPSYNTTDEQMEKNFMKFFGVNQQ